MVSFRDKSIFMSRIWWKLANHLGSCPEAFSSRLGQWLIAWEEESVLEKARGVAEAGSTPMKKDEAVSSVVVVDTKKKAGGPGETSKAEYLERMKDLELEYLASRQDLVEVLGLKSLSHEDPSNHYCVDWLKAHEAHFSRDKTLETADLTGIPKRSIMGPVNYRPLKELEKLGLIVEAPKHRTSIARIRVAIPAQLRAVEKLLDPKSMGLPDTAYMVRS